MKAIGCREAVRASALALGVLAAAASPAAAIAVDSITSNTETSDSNMAISHTTGAGADRLMLVGVSLFDGSGSRQVDKVTYGGQPLTFVGARLSPGDQVAGEIWLLSNPPSGTANVVVNLDGVAGIAQHRR